MNKNLMPDLFNKKEQCCGCTACYAICPRSAIEMIPDEEGFLYPEIDKTKCIRCFRCLNICPLRELKSVT